MKRSAPRTKKVINITFLPVKQYKYQIFSTIKKTIMENKYFIDKIANIYVSTLCKHNYIFINIYGFLSYFLYHRFLPFFTFFTTNWTVPVIPWNLFQVSMLQMKPLPFTLFWVTTNPVFILWVQTIAETLQFVFLSIKYFWSSVFNFPY